MSAGFVDFLRMVLGWRSGAGYVPPPPVAFPSPVGALRWPLSLHLYDAPGGMVLWTFEDPVGLSLSDNERGFEALSGFQEMQAWEAYLLYDLAPAKWLVLACGPAVVWEGRIEDRKAEPRGFSWTALGARRALDDAPYTALWSFKGVAGIRPVTEDEVTGAAPHLWGLDNNNRIYFELNPNNTYGDDVDMGVQVFMMPHRGETEIEAIEFSYDFDLPADWDVIIEGRAEGFGSATAEWTFTSAGTPDTDDVVQVLGTPCQLLTVTVVNRTGGPVTGASGYAKLTSVRIKGTASATVEADEIVGALVAFVSALNPGQLSSSTAGVQGPGVDLEDVVYEDATPAAVLEDLIARGDDQTPPRTWEWGVWEDQGVVFQPRGANARTWFVDVEDDFVLDSTLEGLVNQAYALYQDPNGRTLRTQIGTVGESVARYGITRRGAVDAGQTTSAVRAEGVRDAFLEEGATMAPRASLTLYGLFDATGAWYPLWLLRSGDTVVIRNLPPTLSAEVDRIRTFRVVRKVYDVEADVLTPTPEFPLPGVEVQIARALGQVGGNVPGAGVPGTGVGFSKSNRFGGRG